MSLVGYAYGWHWISSGGVIPGTSFLKIDVLETEATIRARTGDDVGTIAFATDTHYMYVFDGTHWQFYINPYLLVIPIRELLATIRARSGDDVGTIAFATDTQDMYVYDGTHWQIYENS